MTIQHGPRSVLGATANALQAGVTRDQIAAIVDVARRPSDAVRAIQALHTSTSAKKKTTKHLKHEERERVTHDKPAHEEKKKSKPAKHSKRKRSLGNPPPEKMKRKKHKHKPAKHLDARVARLERTAAAADRRAIAADPEKAAIVANLAIGMSPADARKLAAPPPRRRTQAAPIPDQSDDDFTAITRALSIGLSPEAAADLEIKSLRAARRHRR